MAEFLENPFFVGAILIGFIVIVIFLIFGKKIKGSGFKRFVPQVLKKTVIDEFKKKFDLQGIKFKGKLYIGLNQVAKIEKYFEGKGTFSSVYFQEGSKDVIVEEEGDTQYDLMFIRASSKNPILRILGLKKRYFVIKKKENGKEIVKIDPIRKSLFFPSNMDLISYGGVWHNAMDSIEYVNDVSMKRMMEIITMHMENIPDKVAHMEQEQSKLERTARIYANVEKSKWEDKKSAGDTTIG